MSCCWLKALIISFGYSLLLVGNWMIKISLVITLSSVQMVQNKLKWPFTAKFLSVLLLLFRWPGVLCLFPLWVNRESADEATGPDSGSRWSRLINRLWFTGKSERSHLGLSELPVPGQLAQSVSWGGKVIKLKEVGVSALLPLTQLSFTHLSRYPSRYNIFWRKSRTNSLFSKILPKVSPYFIIIAHELLHKCSSGLKRLASSEAMQMKRIR